MTSLARKIAIGSIGLLVLFAVSLSLAQFITKDATPTDSAPELANLPVTPPPPMTPTMQAVLDKSKGFNVLISYTDRGFEPSDVAITKGQTVRFTNNSSRTMWIMSTGGASGVYPGSTDSCGQSAFDTCMALAPNEIWEFTFDVPGEWGYQNTARKQDIGIVRVK